MDQAQREILAHVLVDESPDDYYARVVKTFGQELADQHLANKVGRHSAAYVAAKARDGDKYEIGVVRTTNARREALSNMDVTAEQIERALQPAVRLKDLRPALP